jgi:chromate transporter
LQAAVLIVGGLPLWNRLRAQASFQAVLSVISAAVVGLLLAALYHPVWTSAIYTPGDFAFGLLDFLLLAFWKWHARWSCRDVPLYHIPLWVAP